MAASCGVPAAAPERLRSSKTVPDSDALASVTTAVAVLLPPGKSSAPMTAGLVSTVALFVAVPPGGRLSMRTGMRTVATPAAFNGPSAQLTARPVLVQLPLPAGRVRVQVIGPVMVVPAGSVSARLVCSVSLGPLLTTVTTHSKGCVTLTLDGVAALLTRMSTMLRAVVSSVIALLTTKVSFWSELTVDVLLNTSPVTGGRSSTS